LKQNDTFFLAFFVVIAVLGFAGGLFFRLNNNVKLRKRLLPQYHIGLAVLVALFILIAVASGKSLSLLIVIPILPLITWSNLRNSSICEKCGKFNYTYLYFVKAEYCGKCGAKLQP